MVVFVLGCEDCRKLRGEECYSFLSDALPISERSRPLHCCSLAWMLPGLVTSLAEASIGAPNLTPPSTTQGGNMLSSLTAGSNPGVSL